MAQQTEQEPQVVDTPAGGEDNLVDRIRNRMTGGEPAPEMMNAILLQVEANPALANHPEIKKMIEIADELVDAAPTPEPSKKKDEPAASAEPSKKKTEPAATASDGLEFLNDIPFFKQSIDVKGIKAKDVPTYVKKTFNIDMESDEGAETFLSTVNKFRKDSQELSSVAKEVEAYKGLFAEMPAQLRMVFEAYNGGKDWQAVVQSPQFKFDFDKPFEKQRTEDVVKFYFQDQDFQPSDFSSTGLQDPAMKKLVAAAEKLYNADKQTVELQRVNFQREVNSRKQTFITSVDNSVKALSDKYPDFSTQDLESIKSTLVANRVGDLFYDKNGAFLPDAAERLALVKFGGKILAGLATKLTKQQKTEENINKIKEADSVSKGRKNAQVEPNPAPTSLSWTSQSSDPYSSRGRAAR